MKHTAKKISALALSGTMLLSGLAANPMTQSIFGLPSIVASAADDKTTSDNNAKYTYHISNGVAVVTKIEIKPTASSTFEIPAYMGGSQTNEIAANAVQAANAKRIKTLILPYTVKFIRSAAFQNLSEMTSLTIPNTIKRVKENAFGGNKKIKNVKLFSISQSPYAVTQLIVSQIANETTVQKTAQLDQFNINSNNLGLVELMDALGNTQFADDVCKAKAASIVELVVTPGMNDRQKMTALYNYLISHTRYSSLNQNTDNYLKQMNLRAIGSLYFNSGMCAGFSFALKYLGEAAGLDVQYYVNPEGTHAWNLFRPSGSTKYYKIDSVDRYFCTGTPSGGSVYADGGFGVECPLAENFIGNSKMIHVTNTSNKKFELRLNGDNKMYSRYYLQNYNDAGTLQMSKLPKTNDLCLYTDSTLTYNAYIYDENGINCVKKITSVFSGNNTYTFTYANHTYHLKVTVKNTAGTVYADRTDQSTYYEVSIY